jgi:hypothetical protein
MTVISVEKLEKWIADEIEWSAPSGTHANMVLSELKDVINSGRLSPPVAQGEGLVVEALDIGIKWMQGWLDEHCCECENGHYCGRQARERELEQMKQARESLNTRPTLAREWVPIESAPKDGTWVDVWVSVHDNGAPPGRWPNVCWQDGAWRSPSYLSDGSAGDPVPGVISHYRRIPPTPNSPSGEGDVNEQ